MYYYWVNGKVSPSVFYNMPKGELMVIQAFFEQEIKERNEAMSRIGNSQSVNPVEKRLGGGYIGRVWSTVKP